MSTKTPETDALIARGYYVTELQEHARSLERRNTELTEMVEWQARLEAETTKQVAELTARIAELERECAKIDACLNTQLETITARNTQIDRMRLELTEARKDGQWKPIETAPKDGTKILVYAQEVSNPPLGDEKLPPIVSECAWHEDAGFCVCQIRSVTHWMPLPATPLPSPKETL